MIQREAQAHERETATLHWEGQVQAKEDRNTANELRFQIQQQVWLFHLPVCAVSFSFTNQG